VESRVNAFHVTDRLRYPDPAGEHGDVGDERDLAKEQAPLFPGIAAEHPKLPLVGSQAKDRVQRGRLSGAVGPDQSEDAPFFHPQVPAVERDGLAIDLAQPARLQDRHRSPAFLRFLAAREDRARSAPGAGSSRAPSATAPPKTAGALPRGGAR